MPVTLPNTDIPAGQWVDLYALTGISIGTPISVQNVGDQDVRLTVSESQPPANYDAYNVIMRDNGIRLRNTRNDPGAWAFVAHQDGKLNIRVLAE